MTRSKWSVAFVLAGALIVGCDDDGKGKQTAPPLDKSTLPQPKTDTTTPPKTDTTTPPKTDTTTPPKTDTTTPPKTDTTTPPKTDTTTPPKTDATETPKAAVVAANPEAEGLMTKLEAAIKDNKLDDAKGYLDKLTAMKDKLPATWQTKLDGLKTAYDAAKLKAGGTGTSGIPGLPK